MNRSRTALVVAAGIAAGVTVAGVAAVAAPHHHRVGTSSDASGDVDMQALAQLEGDPSAAPGPSGSPVGPGRGPGSLRGLGMLGGGILHGDLVVQGKDGKPVEVVVQRGTVTSVSGGTLVVHSSDGFDQTWTINADTRYVLGGAFARGPWMHARPNGSGAPSSAPTPSAQPSASSVAKGATVLVLGRAAGGKPTATLVLSGPALMWGPGGDRFRPGGPRWPMGPGMGHHFDGHPPAASPTPSGSASKA
jgi:hypothetical protein